MRRVFVALALALATLVGLVVPQLTHGARRVAGFNGVEPGSFVLVSDGRARVCQSAENLYAGTASVRMTIGTYGRPGPALEMEWRRAGRLLAHGRLSGGWKQGVVHIPLDSPPSATAPGASVCLLVASPARLAWAGQLSDRSRGASANGRAQGARLSLVSERAGRQSLLGQFGAAARHFAAGNVRWMGAWTWWAILTIVVCAIGAAGAALLSSDSGASRLVPRAGWLSALSALLMLSAWALLTPPMQVPDEIAHVAYIQGIAESATLPADRAGVEPYSPQERDLLSALNFYVVIGRPDARPPWTTSDEARVRAAERLPASRETTNASSASGNPPLYYLLETPVYWVTPSGSLLDKLLPMRLLSVLLGSITVLAIFLFLRRLLPRSPWLWSAGALACGFQPMFGFVSSGVNADALLFTCSAITFLLIALNFTRGATTGRVVALGMIIAAGALTKPLFLGLLPAAAATVLVAILRRRRNRPAAARLLGAVTVTAVVPVLAYQVIGAAGFDHPYFNTGSTIGGTVAPTAGSLAGELSYIWQLWLPRAPNLIDQFPGPLPLREVWLQGLLGRFGWLDYGFSPWVLDIYTWVSVLVLVAAAVSLVMSRECLRGRWIELAVYVVAVVGVVTVIGTQQYRSTLIPGSPAFIQSRYLLPLLALYGGLLAVGARLAGRRGVPYLAIALVTLSLVHELSAMLLAVSRYYV
jgi:4-amino-4-deoxy-L-arabinose transferase-like glycosyltransferase